jgi:hypothetical protein
MKNSTFEAKPLEKGRGEENIKEGPAPLLNAPIKYRDCAPSPQTAPDI